MFKRPKMATCNLKQYVQYVEHIYRSCQGLLFSHTLSLSDEHAVNENLWKSEFPDIIPGKCIPPIDRIIINHLLCVRKLHQRYFMEAFEHQSACVQDIILLVRDQQDSNWMLPVLYVASADLRLIAQKADIVSNNFGDIMEKATEILMSCYRVSIGDAAIFQEDSNRQGLLSPVNHVLNIYFRTHKFELCQAMMRAIEPRVNQVPYSLPQQVTFRFFVGRLAVLEGDFLAANFNLVFAFKQSDPDNFSNKRMILTYLLPVKMILGYMPPKLLIDRYNLSLIWELLLAVKEGDLKTFEEIFEDNHKYFVDAGLFIAIENLRMITYRNVFKRVYLSQGSNKVTVACLQEALQVTSKEIIDASKTRLLISTLIYCNKMKAYLSYQRDLVFFNEENAFPRISSLGRTD